MNHAGGLRWGVVGTGGITRGTIPDLMSVDGCHVTAVVSRQQQTADDFARSRGIPFAFHDLATMLSTDLIDAVYVATPHTMHAAITRAAIEAGKHVVCEKPLTMTSAEAQELQALAAQHGVFLLEAMWMSFSPTVRRVMEIIASGEIGSPRLVQASAGFAVSRDAPARFWDPALGAGALFDLGIYTVTLATMALGEVIDIDAAGVLQADGVDLFEAAHLRFANGGVAQTMSSMVTHVPARAWVGGTEGSIDLGPPLFSPGSIHVSTGRLPHGIVERDEHFEREGAGYVPMFRAAAEAIRSGAIEHPFHPHDRTLAVLRTLEGIRARLALTSVATA